MSALTRIVRPNQSVNIDPPKLPDVPAVTAKPNIVVEIGANGTGKVMPGNLSFNRTQYQDKKPKEQQGGLGRVIDLSSPF